MARLFTFFVLALMLVNVKSEEDCLCEEMSDEEKQKIWDFLTRVSEEMSEEEGVLPGILSPMVPCGNCLDGARKKRTVLPPVEETKPDTTSAEFDGEDDVVVPRADPRCPVGYGRIAFRCISLADLYKK